MNSLKNMIDSQIIKRGIRDKRVIEAMLKIDRADFVLPEDRDFAYSDSPLPLMEGQTISQPYIVALMTESLELNPEDNVLEIGTGSGYQTAILAYLSKSVVSIERIYSLHLFAQENLKKYNLNNIEIIHGDGKELIFEQKFDKIIITAAAKTFPEKIFENLKEGGIMVAPIEQGFYQVLYKVIKREGKPDFRQLCHVRFVPLV